MAFARRGQSNRPIETNNAFGALLDDDKKKKKKDKKKLEEPEPLKSLSPIDFNGSMNWADAADSDEDMFGSTPNWGDQDMGEQCTAAAQEADDVEEDEEEHDDDEEEDPTDNAQLTMNSSKAAVPIVEEKQLSKKERKRLEMEELDKALADLGIQENAQQPAQNDASNEQPQQPAQAEAVSSNKSRKKRGGKKKNASADEPEAEAADSNDPHPTLDPELKGSVQDNGSLDTDAVAKLIAAKHGKKKTSASGGVTSAAAKEAAARKSGAKGKKKDKKNYNQQPTR